jgi:DNA-binding response OmpR family regulator
MAPGAHVLIAEDEYLIALSLQRELARHGYRVSLAADGNEALRKSGEDPIDALVTDIKMPKLDGIDLIERLRRDRRYLPVVVVSAHISDQVERRLAETGNGRLLVLGKPVDYRRINTWLASVLIAAMNRVKPEDRETCRKLRAAADEIRGMARGETETRAQEMILTAGRLERIAQEIEHPD